MRKLLIATLALSLLGGAAWAQTFTKSLQGSQDPRGPVALDANNNAFFPNHINAFGNLGINPTFTCVATCGTPTSGTDNAGTVQTSGTTLTITFGQAFGAKPSCIVQEEAGTTAPTYTVATTGILATTVVSAKAYDYNCVGNQ